MACGTPVVTSNAASLPESSGTAGLTACPDDVGGLAGHVVRLLTDSEFRQNTITKGLRHAGSFRWRRNAEEVMKVYESVLEVLVQRMLISGGAGFIGVNSARYFAERGWRITVLDNLSRPGAIENLAWLRERVPDLKFREVDVRDFQKVHETLSGERIDVLLHLAGQVAVTTSVALPREDFEINAQGDTQRARSCQAGEPAHVRDQCFDQQGLRGRRRSRRQGGEFPLHYAGSVTGVSETQPLDFHSPYGCSKGVAGSVHAGLLTCLWAENDDASAIMHLRTRSSESRIRGGLPGLRSRR